MIAFFRDEEGQGLVEYALIIAVIAIAVIVAMIFLRGQLQNIFSNIGNNLTYSVCDIAVHERPGKPGRSFYEGLQGGGLQGVLPLQ